jgi:uncharacterized membrane protein YeaQ/YmgE (transglycosylase-associated protein family)
VISSISSTMVLDLEDELTCGEFITAVVGTVVLVAITVGSVVLGRGDLGLFFDFEAIQ